MSNAVNRPGLAGSSDNAGPTWKRKAEAATRSPPCRDAPRDLAVPFDRLTRVDRTRAARRIRHVPGRPAAGLRSSRRARRSETSATASYGSASPRTTSRKFQPYRPNPQDSHILAAAPQLFLQKLPWRRGGHTVRLEIFSQRDREIRRRASLKFGGRAAAARTAAHGRFAEVSCSPPRKYFLFRSSEPRNAPPPDLPISL
jgi:hypothetical protein